MRLLNFFNKTTNINIGGTIIKISNKKEAEFYANQFLKHCNESTKIVNTTANPKVFFERYSFLLHETKNLSNLEIFLKFKGRTPSSTLVYLIQSKERETNLMISRAWESLDIKLKKLKTKRGKENRINNLYFEFQSYLNEMSKTNIDLCKSYYNTFINGI